jgi:orotidine-5'-phosphate decarboxylase
VTSLPQDTPIEVRSRIAVALDVDDEVAALRIARAVAPHVGVAKVGMELYYAAGPSIVGALASRGFDVFCDLKLYDIPTTVRKAARVVGSLGARYLNSPAAAGAATVEAMVEGFLDGAADAETADPVPLAVTVLTSEARADEAVLRERVAIASAAGCRGVVCGASDLPLVHEVAPGLQTVVPGIRPQGAEAHDQGRIATPGDAASAGATLLVVGRPITLAADPAAAAAAIAAEVASAAGAATRRE